MTSRSTSADPNVVGTAACGGAPAWWGHGDQAVPPTSAMRADANILLPQDLSSSVSNFATQRASSAPIRIRPDSTTAQLAVRWTYANRGDLGVTHLIVAGESGGGNLTLTVGHKAKREGWLHEIAGFYAQCPFISNRWHEPPDELPSLRECDGYFISLQQLVMMGSIYDPTGAYARDAAAFAGMATEEELAGMPPHVISVNELDPLRDEGLAYYRKLVRAGVPAVGRIVAGTCHGGDLLLPGIMPEVFESTMRDVSGFAKSLG